MRPVGWILDIPFWSFFTANMAGVDLVQNVVLFAPLGWIAQRAGWPVWRAALAGLFVSASIEFAQQWVPGRTSTAMDIACNTAGATLAWWAATRAVRPRVRVGVAFAVLAAFASLHVANTAWPDLVERADGTGAWSNVSRLSCPASTPASTACITVPNDAQVGNKYVRIVGPQERTYARVQSNAFGRPMTRNDCVRFMFEATVGATLHLRPPLTQACAVADAADSVVALRVDPRLEFDGRGAWLPTRAGAWMWPVWPFMAYQPAVLRAVGAVAFVVLAALMSGWAPWVLPAGYLLTLEVLALLTGLGGPGLWDFGWAAIGWLLALAAVQADRWWRAHAVLLA
ncbi:MAG: VanZ family protein [Gemmatimonadetes bacterium]|nr:VanZ family protein [Gemmatimonadota bacterium]